MTENHQINMCLDGYLEDPDDSSFIMSFLATYLIVTSWNVQQVVCKNSTEVFHVVAEDVTSSFSVNFFPCGEYIREEEPEQHVAIKQPTHTHTTPPIGSHRCFFGFNLLEFGSEFMPFRCKTTMNLKIRSLRGEDFASLWGIMPV